MLTSQVVSKSFHWQQLKNFFTIYDSSAPVEAKDTTIVKFESKFLVRQAIVQDEEVSEPFLTTRSINTEIYCM